jgi:hypothetical protein
VTEVLFEDNGWELKRDLESYASDPMKYWISHQCEGKLYPTLRAFSVLNGPCECCGSVCPEGLQGLYLMMEYL